ncbi:HD family phosphohydrolase [Ectobacillus ponti]|uniref:HD family phosphohydrolase n=1 Tax=Ectobacillus ponti TaxID=2961894 RepID=A0AA42BN04_9BACI|nr:HD family phosphohydrolase [Ectobacillus ponti]MCP8967167.1 HD family phosphohydrolase [Ectobacillus ponti]
MFKSKRLLFKMRQLHQSKLVGGILYVLLGTVIFLALVGNVRPDELDVKLLSIAKKSIHSPVTIEDKVTTERRKREAAQTVEDQYTYRSEYKQNRSEIISSIFEAVKEVQDEDRLKEKLEQQPPAALPVQLDKLKEKLPADVLKSLSNEVLQQLLKASPDQLLVAKESTLTAVNNRMSTHIKIHEVNRAREQIADELRYANVNSGLKTAIIEIGQYAIVPNYVFDPAATEERRKVEMDAVEPAYILQGQILVKQGDTITREVYDQLKLVGLLDNGHAFQPFLGLMLLVGVLLFFLVRQFVIFFKNHREDKPYVMAYVLIVTVTIIVMKTLSLFQNVELTSIGYVMPVAMGTLLIKLMIGDRFVVPTSILFSVCGSIMFNEGITSTFNYAVGLYMLISSLSVSAFLTDKYRRSPILRAGLLVSLVNVLTVGAILLLRSGHTSWTEVGLHLLMAAASGIISSILTMGLLPYLEGGLGIVSTMRLTELASPNHPLLRKILLEAPGTYHHSIMVANLSEAACEAIGANGLLARVGAYYHDIGKTVRPQFFIENQMGQLNPHDQLTPEMSRDIILAHVTDGVKLLKEHRIPQEIVKIAAQHHGTTLLKYFYYKASKQDKEAYTEEMFRYPGPKADFKESAVVGIADSVEAAVRSMDAPTPEQIEQLVEGIIADRLQDGQFNECELTFKELQIVRKALCEALNGIFHSRITYPTLSKEKVK